MWYLCTFHSSHSTQDKETCRQSAGTCFTTAKLYVGRGDNLHNVTGPGTMTLTLDQEPVANVWVGWAPADWSCRSCTAAVCVVLTEPASWHGAGRKSEIEEWSNIEYCNANVCVMYAASGAAQILIGYCTALTTKDIIFIIHTCILYLHNLLRKLEIDKLTCCIIIMYEYWCTLTITYMY